MYFERTARFKRDYRSLPDHIKDQVDDLLEEIAAGALEGWRQKKLLRGWKGIWAVRVDPQEYRLTYKDHGERIVLRRVGKHQVYDEP